MSDWREHVQAGDWSVGAVLAWQIAGSEARQQGYSKAEPLHLLIGLCSIRKTLLGNLGDVGVSKDAEASLRSERETLSSIFESAGMNETIVRRAARAALRDDKVAGNASDEIVPSEATTSVLAYAAQLARESKADFVGLAHLSMSLLECQSGAVVQFLAECRVNVNAFTSAVRNAVSSGGVLATETGQDLEINRTIAVDASAIPRAAAIGETLRSRLTLLYELPIQFGEQADVGSLLQIIVERLISVIPGAARGALLLAERPGGALLLKAHLPPGRPAVSLTLAQRAMNQREGFIWSQGQDLNASMREMSSVSGMYAPLVCHDEVLGVVCVDNPRRGQPFAEDDLRLLLAVARYAALALANLSLKQELQQNAVLLGRLLTNFSPSVRECLLAKARQGKLRLGGERSEVTILCADIRGFTRLSAKMDAQEVMDLLNSYFPALVDAVFRFNGSVDKYVGDAILAVFGSPDPDVCQHENAIRAAAGMQSAMDTINTERATRNLTTCQIGIGVDCGEVLHGFIGSPEHIEFTVIGDAVNKATRYCDGAGGGEILISPRVHERTWRIMRADPLSIPTKHEGNMSAYRVAGVKPV